MRTVKIYQIRYQTQDGKKQIYASSKAKCGRIRKDLRRINGPSCILSTTPINFPLNQTAIIDWLNGQFK